MISNLKLIAMKIVLYRQLKSIPGNFTALPRAIMFKFQLTHRFGLPNPALQQSASVYLHMYIHQIGLSETMFHNQTC